MDVIDIEIEINEKLNEIEKIIKDWKVVGYNSSWSMSKIEEVMKEINRLRGKKEKLERIGG